MRIGAHPFFVLEDQQVDLIHGSALRILDEMGMVIEHPQLLSDLAEIGMTVNLEDQRVRFPKRAVENFISEVPNYDWDAHIPQVTAFALF